MSRKIRIGIIGTGWWATENHIPVLQQFADVEIAGMCGLGREALQKTQKRFSIPFATEDYRELLGLPGLDGVVVSSPHHLHHEHALAALEQVLHVLCEKPMALSADHAREMAAVAERRSRHFVIAYGWNYTDLAAEAKRRVAAGEIGQIEHVHVHMASALRELFSGEGAWFAENAFLQPQLQTWSDPALGGGFGHGQLTHALGLLFWITELQPAEVFAFAAYSRTGADLTQAIGCRFTNGATGMMGGAATMPPGSLYQLDIRLFGTEGILLLDIERPRLEIRRNNGEKWSMRTACAPGAYACVEPLRTFVDLIQGKEVENRSPATVGVRAVEVLEAAFRSARSMKIEAIC